MSDVIEFACGCLGAIFPEIVRQYSLRHDPAPVPASYFLRSTLFCLASGAVVLALPGELTAISAIYAGTSAPLLVSVGAREYVRHNGKGEINPPTSAGSATDDIDVQDDPSRTYLKVENDLFVESRGWSRFWLAL